MKLFSFLLTVVMATASICNAQVGIGTDTPDASAVLEVKSDNKGLLIPRMIGNLRGQIAAPVEGLLVYQTDGEAGFYFYTSAGWVRLAGASEIVANEIYEVYGTSGVSPSVVGAFVQIPGLQKTIVLPAGSKVYVHTDGGIQNPNAGSTGDNSFAAVEIAIEVDNVLSTQAGRKIVTAANTAGVGQVVANWSLGKTYTFESEGTHTFKIKAAKNNGANANVSSGASPQIQGVLTITVIK